MCYGVGATTNALNALETAEAQSLIRCEGEDPYDVSSEERINRLSGPGRCSRRDLVRVLKAAQRITERDVPTPHGASGARSRPRMGPSTSDALVDRGRGPSVAVGV